MSKGLHESNFSPRAVGDGTSFGGATDVAKQRPALYQLMFSPLLAGARGEGPLFEASQRVLSVLRNAVRLGRKGARRDAASATAPQRGQVTNSSSST